MKKEAEERKMTKAELKKMDTEERQELRNEYKAKMAALQAEQKERKKSKLRPIHSGGLRKGAGRPKSTPHTINIVAGEDLNPRKTYTVYAAADEMPAVRHFLKVWRELKFETPDVFDKLGKLKGGTVYELLTGLSIAIPAEGRKIEKNMPKVYELHKAFTERHNNKTDNQK